MSTRSDWLHSTLTPSTIAASGPYPHGYFGTTFWDQVSSLSWFARPAVSESATCLSTGHIPGPAADGLLPSNRQELAAEPTVAAALIQDKRKGVWPAGRLGAGKPNPHADPSDEMVCKRGSKPGEAKQALDSIDHSGRSAPPAASRETTTLRTKRSTSPATSRSSSSSTTRFARTAPSSETFSLC